MSESGHAERLRIVIDVNILISFLIRPGNATRTINRAVRIATSELFQMMLPTELVIELRNAPRKPNLSPLLTDEMVEDFISTTLLPAGILVDTEQSSALEVSQVVRDRKDRYLLEAAIQHDVDILISGDKDLLVLAEFFDLPRILSPAQFVAAFGEG